MSISENTEIAETIDRAFTGTFGGRASSGEVFREVAVSLPDHLQRHLVGVGLKTAIGRYFRTQRNDGLPQAPEANADGVHVQLEFLEVPEFRYVIEQQLKASAASHSQAAKLAALCERVHGVTIPLEFPGAAA